VSAFTAAELLAARTDLADLRDTLAHATLTKVETATTLAGNGDPTGWTASWTGAAPAYLSRDHREVKDTTRHDQRGPVELERPVNEDVLTVLDDVAAVLAAVGPDLQGRRVTITDNRTGTPVTLVRTVVESEHQAQRLLSTLRLVLDPSGG
jgi:hypothetical protein